MPAPRTIYLVPARVPAVSARPIAAPRTTAVHPPHRPPAPMVYRTVQPPSTSLKRPHVEMAADDEEDPLEVLLNGGSGQGPPRKRERLNHLSSEEKLNRRKLKNRVAAQTARDRKKARSQRLEEVVRQLMEENQKLREENSRLRTERNQKKETAVESAEFINGRLPSVQAVSLLPLLFLLSSISSPKTLSTVFSKISRTTSTSTSSRANCLLRKTSKPSLWRAPLSRPRRWQVP